MTTTTQIQTQKISTSVKLFFAVVLMVISSNGVFGQNNTAVLVNTNSTEISISKNSPIETVTENAIASTSMDFAVWFTGNVKNTTDSKSNNGSFSKKQLINSGVKTNSVLIRSILKKVSVQGSSVA